jgi:hypothetical protein
MLRRHRRRLLELRPAAVLFITARSDLAGIVEQLLAHLLPPRVTPVQADGIGLLDLDDPAAAPAAYSEDMLRELGQPQRG